METAGKARCRPLTASGGLNEAEWTTVAPPAEA